jgi:hypothetical protein
VQRARWLAPGKRRVGGLGLPAGKLGVERDDRVQLGIVLLDPREVGVQRVHRGDLPGAQPRRQLARRQGTQFV